MTKNKLAYIFLDKLTNLFEETDSRSLKEDTLKHH